MKMNPQTTSLKLSAGSVSNILKFSHNSGTATKTSSSSSQDYSEVRADEEIVFATYANQNKKLRTLRFASPEHALMNVT